jgi:hypothetical protein
MWHAACSLFMLCMRNGVSLQTHAVWFCTPIFFVVVFRVTNHDIIVPTSRLLRGMLGVRTCLQALKLHVISTQRSTRWQDVVLRDIWMGLARAARPRPILLPCDT